MVGVFSLFWLLLNVDWVIEAAGFNNKIKKHSERGQVSILKTKSYRKGILKNTNLKNDNMSLYSTFVSVNRSNCVS